MQRAAASTPSVPQSQDRTSDNPSSKRQKVSATPSWTTTSPSDRQLIQVALAEEEEQRGKAMGRLAEEAGETNWILSTVNGEEGNYVGGLRVATAGYSDIDQEAWRPGRRSFGKFNRELEVGPVNVFKLHLLIMIRHNMSVIKQIFFMLRCAKMA